MLWAAVGKVFGSRHFGQTSVCPLPLERERERERKEREREKERERKSAWRGLVEVEAQTLLGDWAGLNLKRASKSIKGS